MIKRFFSLHDLLCNFCSTDTEHRRQSDRFTDDHSTSEHNAEHKQAE